MAKVNLEPAEWPKKLNVFAQIRAEAVIWRSNGLPNSSVATVEPRGSGVADYGMKRLHGPTTGSNSHRSAEIVQGIG